MTHWHVEAGLAGYGPEAADTDGFTVYRALTDVADAIRGELDSHAEYEVEVARTYAEHGDYEAAWKLREHADELDTMAGNFSNTRADAPAYAGHPDRWNAEIIRLITVHIPVDVNEGRTRIYAWMCDETECGQDDRPGITLTREQIETWVGRPVSDEIVERLTQAIPHSSVPDAINTIVTEGIDPDGGNDDDE